MDTVQILLNTSHFSVSADFAEGKIFTVFNIPSPKNVYGLKVLVTLKLIAYTTSAT